MSDNTRTIASKRDWFRFSDYEQFTPIRGGEITTHALKHFEQGTLDDVTWVKEEWKIDALVARLSDTQSLQNVLDTLGHDFLDCDYEFKPCWDDDGFNFAEHVSMYGLTLEPWISQYRDVANTNLRLAPRPDFLTYHCLNSRRVSENSIEYVLPFVGQAVLHTRCEDIAYYLPMANAVVHIDYLKDFLAARKAVLILSVVADRFLNAPTVEELEIDDLENERIGQYASITTTIHPPSSTHSASARGRSSLYWNIVVFPYDYPKPSRSVWPNFGFESPPVNNSPMPTFFADFEGVRIAAKDAGRLTYFYFQPQVLQKYLTAPGYSIYFVMRHWGRAGGPHDDGIDLGINSRGLVTAYAGDIAALNADEQAYWASYSCIPSGEVCEELFETRMQQNPPHSPNTVELLTEARDALGEAFTTAHASTLYNRFDLSDRDQQRISVGPLLGADEISALAQALYEWVIAPMDIAVLRKALDSMKVSWEDNWRQIKLLDVLMASKRERQGTPPTAALRMINDLRVKQSHTVSRSVEDIFTLYGVEVRPFVARPAWLRLVDILSQALHDIAATPQRP